MTKKHIDWYKKGKTVRVNDKMQSEYSYKLTYNAGTNIQSSGIKNIKYSDFKPHYTPQQMLNMGVFEGKYLNDCQNEFPKQWYITASKYDKLRLNKPDSTVNYFQVKSRLSLIEWKKRGWIPIHPNDNDVRGWFQWYCRYWIGRRQPDIDSMQIKRWKAFKRHFVQVKKNAAGDLNKRRKQRQALLQWSWNAEI